MSLNSLFQKIMDARRDELGRDAGPYPKSNPVASDLGPCPRETALAILHWQERPSFNEIIKARLEVGREAEPVALSKLLRYGAILVEQQQMFELKDKHGRVILRGKIDGKIEWEKKRIPFDYKTVTPLVFPRLNSVEDLLQHQFFRKWPKQLWAYEYMNDIDTGFLLLDNLLGGWKFIEISLDYDAMEGILRQCEQAIDAVEAVRTGKAEADVLPPFHADPAVCRRCWAFGRICTPPVEYQGLKLMEDVDLETKLNRRGELEAAHREYEALDGAIKDTVKGQDGLLVGRWLIQGKEVTRSYKPQDAKTVTFWQAKITKAEADGPEAD